MISEYPGQGREGGENVDDSLEELEEFVDILMKCIKNINPAKVVQGDIQNGN